MTEDHVDHAAAVALIGTLIGYLPTVALVLTIAWYVVRFYDRFKKGGR